MVILAVSLTAILSQQLVNLFCGQGEIVPPNPKVDIRSDSTKATQVPAKRGYLYLCFVLHIIIASFRLILPHFASFHAGVALIVSLLLVIKPKSTATGTRNTLR